MSANGELSDGQALPDLIHDFAAHLALAGEAREEATKAARLLQDLKARVMDNELDTTGGLSLLELKNHLMLDYLANLSFVMLKKASGKRLEGDKAIERLVTTRTVLEKVRPMEQKLKYQISKALKVAESGEIKADDPLHFKANPSALVSKLADDDEDDSDEDEEASAPKNPGGKYVVPKHVPAFFDDGGANDDGAERENAVKKKKQLLSRGLIDELKRQHLDTPEEVYEQEDVMKKRHVQAIKERIRYEEDNFLRLPLAKKTKHSRRQMSTMGTIGDEVTSFGTNFFTEGKAGGKKRKQKGGKKSAAKKKFKK